MNNIVLGTILTSIFILVGCETTTSRSYTPSTKNVLAMQEKINSESAVKLKDFQQPKNAGTLTCRLSGPVDVSPGMTEAGYIEEALRTELFMAKVYDAKSTNELNGTLNSFSFSSISPAKWTLNFTIYSGKSKGYTVESTYPFNTSFSAWGACKNVADAFAPAVQQLISDVVNHPKFEKLL